MTSLLQRRIVRLTIFMLALILIPTAIIQTMSYRDSVEYAKRMCPRGGHLDDIGVLVPVVFEGDSRVNQYSPIRCEYTILLPKVSAMRYNALPPGPFTPEIQAEITAAIKEWGIRTEGVASGSWPSILKHGEDGMLFAGMLLGAYASLVLLVWGLVWVWRGNRSKR